MKRYLLLLALPLLLATCGKDLSVDTAIVGRWSLVALLDSAGNWQPLLFPLESRPPAIEFRQDGLLNYFGSNGKVQRACCQPTRYTYQPVDCPINASCSSLGIITYTDWVQCSSPTCTFPQKASVGGLNGTYLELYVSPIQGRLALRYQRIN